VGKGKKCMAQHRKSKFCAAVAAAKAKKPETIDLSKDDKPEKPSEKMQLIATEVASIVTARQAVPAVPVAPVAPPVPDAAPAKKDSLPWPTLPSSLSVVREQLRREREELAKPPSPRVKKRWQRTLTPPPSPQPVMKRRRPTTGNTERGDCVVCGHLFCDWTCPRRQRSLKDEDYGIRLDQVNMKLNVIMDMLREIYRDFP